MQARMNLRTMAADGLQGMFALEAYLNTSGLSRNLLDLLRLRVSQINGCAYCVDMHARDLKPGGRER